MLWNMVRNRIFVLNTSPPLSLYFDFKVKIKGPLKDPDSSVCCHGACFRKELTLSEREI